MSLSLARHGILARRPRRLTTFVSLLWLNLAMLPCTMAAGSEEHSGQQPCPPSAAVSHHAHASGHDSAGGHGGHHDAGPVHSGQHHDATNHPCMASDNCCELDDILFSDGAKKLERDSGVLPPTSFASNHAEAIGTSVRNLRATGPPRAFGGSVRVHALNCVYRD